MKSFSLLVVFTTAFFGWSPNLEAGPIILSIQASSTNSTASAEVQIEGLQGSSPNGPALGAFDFLLGYNPTFLANPTVSFGDPALGDQLALTVPALTCLGTNCGSATNFPLEIGEVSLDSVADLNGSQASVFTLATITFQIVSPGTSSLTLSNVILGDAEGNALIPDLIEGATIPPVSQTPEPQTGVLASLGALLLAGSFTRRRFLSRANLIA